MTMRYDKLVRDHIPTIIEKSGRTCHCSVLDEAEYQEALRAKLVEEATEVLHASDEDLATELADVLEVLEAIIKARGLSQQDVANIRIQRLRERGGFERRIKLIQVD